MKLYYIYHVPGIKVGCTSKPSKRLANQGYSEYQILEVYEDIHIASERERIIQKQLGYSVDTIPYWQLIEYGKEGHKIGGNITGYNHYKNGTGLFAMPKEKLIETSKKVGRKHVESGHWAKVRRSNVTKGMIWVNNGTTQTLVLPEKLQEYLQQGFVKGMLKRK